MSRKTRRTIVDGTSPLAHGSAAAKAAQRRALADKQAQYLADAARLQREQRAAVRARMAGNPSSAPADASAILPRHGASRPEAHAPSSHAGADGS